MKNPFRSLPARIVAFVFGAVMLTSLTVMGLAINSIDSFLHDEINRKFPAALEARSEKLDHWYGQRERELEVFSQSEVLLGNLPALARPERDWRRDRAVDEVAQYMRYVLDGFHQYSALYILDPAGGELLWVGQPVPLDDSDRKALASVTAPTVGGLRHLGDGDVQIVSAPLRAGPDAEISGTLHAILAVETIQNQLTIDEVALPNHAFVVDPRRKVLVSSDASEVGTDYAGPLPTATDAVIVEEYERSRGERIVGGARAFERFGWTLVVEEPYEQAFAPVVGAMRDVLLINLAIVLAVGVATFRIATSITRPIEALSRAARQISDGERNVAIPAIDQAGEVGVLSRAFRGMTLRLTQNATELEQSHKALEEANEHLHERNEELHRVNEVLEQLSITDGLTKLHNHRHFQEVLLRECKRADRNKRPLSLILIDIDRFKLWNDRLGHAGGDEILRHMSEVLTRQIRETDLLARYGGEEFALIAANTDLEGARLLAEKIRVTVGETSFLLDPPSEREPVTVSVGVASYAGDRVRFFGDADRALYHAKESGRDCVMTAEDLG